MRILLSAFAFSPYSGSECAVGWSIANELAKLHDVTVLCGDVSGEMRTKKDLERYGRQTGNLRIEYVAPTWFIALLERLHNIPGLWGLYYLAYNLWQREAYARAKEIHAEKPFDVAHQLNMIGYREPGYLWKLPIPFVWGPVGGGPNEPMAFHKMFSWCGCVKVFLRSAANEIQKRTCLRGKNAARIARKIWAVTEADYRMIHDLWGVECEMMVETGTVLRKNVCVRRWDGQSTLKIVWSGIHTSRKALPILLYALSRLKSMDWWCDILGVGPETESWKMLAIRIGVAERLSWHGNLTHEDAIRVMGEGHLFAFPSIKEGTPHVVLEALSLGLPVICHDACGMGIVVTDECGFKVPLNNPEMSIAGFADAIKAVMADPSLVATKSTSALARAKELTWEMKAKQIAEAYNEITTGKS